MANQGQVDKEVEHLQNFIMKLGKKNNDGKYVVTFGTLFDDDEAQQVFEAIVGTLRAAKKKNIVSFKGQMLLKGAHDNVEITLLKEPEKKEDEDNNNNNNNNKDKEDKKEDK